MKNPKSRGATSQGFSAWDCRSYSPTVNPWCGYFSYPVIYICIFIYIYKKNPKVSRYIFHTLKSTHQDKTVGSAHSWKSEIQKLGRGLGFVWAERRVTITNES